MTLVVHLLTPALIVLQTQEGQEFLERSGKKDAAGDSKNEGKEGQK